MSLDIWVPAATLTQAGTFPGAQSVAGVNKLAASGVDDTVAFWSAAAGYSWVNLWRLTATPSLITTPHGAITQVRLYARMYRSQAGPDYWFSDTYPWPRPFYAPFVTIGGTKHWRTPDSWGGYAVGVRVDGNLNTNNPGSWSPTLVAWDITALATWTNAVIQAMDWGLSCNNEDLGGFVKSGQNQETYQGLTAPQHRVSQLVLRVTADDPPAGPALANQGVLGE